MSDAFILPAPHYALVLSSAAVVEFDSLDRLAAAIVARGPTEATYAIRRGWCTARAGWPEASLNVYSIAERAAFLGYVLGADHLTDELQAALHLVKGGRL
jgi:hypothetical protein